jgi:N utilization substance protein B
MVVANQQVNPSARRKARHYAMQALYQWHMTKYPLNEIEAQFRTDYEQEFKKVDSDFFHELVHEVPANLTELQDTFTPHLVERTLEELDPIELALLRLGSYELLKRIDIPFKVAINETVSLAKKFGAAEGHKYINGVLDKVAQDVRAVEIKATKK